MSNDRPLKYSFLSLLAKIINSGQSRAVLLTGEVRDLFYSASASAYVPLIDFLTSAWGGLEDRIIVVYELNGPIRFVRESDKTKVGEVWLKCSTGLDRDEIAIQKVVVGDKEREGLRQLEKYGFDSVLEGARKSSVQALELLRLLCACSRAVVKDKPLMSEQLIIIIEGADMLIPQGEIPRLSEADRYRVMVCQDWFSDPGFMNANDAVILVSESASTLNDRVAKLPQLSEVSIGAPDEKSRAHVVATWEASQGEEKKIALEGMTRDEFVKLTAGLSVHALLQLLRGVAYEARPLTAKDVVGQVETHIRRKLGDDVVEFKKPEHTLKDVVGFGRLKEFLIREFMPRVRTTGKGAISGAAVCGPLGAGKTFIFEAVAAELGIVVLVLKNLRSKWFGETDVIFERLARVLDSLPKVLIFMDEADTQFGGVGADVHETERRLTGKLQAMMSDPKLRGRVVWLLMTARIHLLSPDLRRPGRVGDLIIPILDPEGTEREEFVCWMVGGVLQETLDQSALDSLVALTQEFSAASFASLRSELEAKANGGKLNVDVVRAIIEDHIPPFIGEVREYQRLQALLNCTRRSLLPNLEGMDVTAWREKLQDGVALLEARGVR